MEKGFFQTRYISFYSNVNFEYLTARLLVIIISSILTKFQKDQRLIDMLSIK